jgi:YfiH family protein
MLRAPNLAVFDWLVHGFGLRDSSYPVPITTVQQIHSGLVVEATQPSVEPIAEADGIVTRRAGLLIGVRTADCVPILIADERTRAVACIHAGWRGTACNIAIAGVNAMISRFGSHPADLRAAIGPAIGPCCYEVGGEVARRFQAWNPGLADVEMLPHVDTPTHIDLPAINEKQLKVAGVKDIWQAHECTFCAHGRFFSFRRERENAGRMLSFIGIS